MASIYLIYLYEIKFECLYVCGWLMNCRSYRARFWWIEISFDHSNDDSEEHSESHHCHSIFAWHFSLFGNSFVILKLVKSYVFFLFALLSILPNERTNETNQPQKQKCLTWTFFFFFFFLLTKMVRLVAFHIGNFSSEFFSPIKTETKPMYFRIFYRQWIEIDIIILIFFFG